MKIVSSVVLAATAGLFVINFGAQVLAQDGARDAAIHRCIMQAQREYPDVSSESSQRNRTMAYKACMTAAGLAP